MFLVCMKYTFSERVEPLIICKTEDLARLYIQEKVKDRNYNGYAYYSIKELNYYEDKETIINDI